MSEDVVTGSATTLSIIPGESEHSARGGGESCVDHRENCDDGGDALDSAMPDYGGKGLDAWFLGDQREDLPTDLSEALAARKEFPEYPGEKFRVYRLKNHLGVSLPSTDGTQIDDWDAVSVDLDEDDPVWVCVEGELEYGEDNAIRTLIEDPPSEFWSWFGGRDKARAHEIHYDGDIVDAGNGHRPRSEDVNRVSVEGPDGETVEGVRVSAIVGGQDTYIRELNELFYRDPVRYQAEFPDNGPEDVPSYVRSPPTVYTFLELMVMADGTTVTRVWDTSPYPHHFLYVDGVRPAEGMDNGLERGTGLNADGSVENGNWVRNQDTNRERFSPWVEQAYTPAGIEPFSPHSPLAYEQNWDADVPGMTPQSHPVMVHGEDGSLLTIDAVRATFDRPLFPWHEA